MEKYNGIERYIFADVYNFLTAYITGDGSDLYWQALMQDARRLNDKYLGNKLSTEMIMAVLNNMEFKLEGFKDDKGRTYLDYQKLKDEILRKG